jgi:ubiquinone/menaquinone biosynthesis C-methylase UbiE
VPHFAGAVGFARRFSILPNVTVRIRGRAFEEDPMTTTTLDAGTTVPDFTAIKTRQQAAWASGDYAVVGTTLQIVGENLAEALDLRAGSRVIDIAAGNGNATLAAARRHCSVVSTDYVPELLEKGSQRALAEHLDVEFRTADAEQLPFPDAAFDVAMSVFGVMFTPEHERAAHEMARVTRRGGQIGLANWTPDSFIGQLFRLLGSYLPPAPGLRSPPLWGTEAHLRDIFGPAIGELRTTRRQFVFRYRSAAHFIEVFRRYYGPVHKAFLALPADKQDSLERDLHALITSCARVGDTLVLPSDYLEAVITRA